MLKRIVRPRASQLVVGLVGWLSCLLVLSLATLGRADANVHSIALYLEGPDADAMRRDIAQAVPAGVTVIDDASARDAAARAGVKGHVAAGLAGAKQRKPFAAKLRQMQSAAGADAVLVAFAAHARGSHDVPALIVSGRNGVVYDEVSLARDDTPSGRVTKWSSFVALVIPPSGGDATSAAKHDAPPAAKQPESSPPTEEAGNEKADADAGPTDKAAPRAPHQVATAIAVMGVAYEAGFRSFSYNDPISSNLRPYHVSAVPGVVANAEIYPLAGSGGPLSDLGLTGKFARAFALSSATTDATKVSTSSYRYEIGLRYRIRTGEPATSPLLGVGVGYAYSAFSFGTPPASSTLDSGQLPSAKYGMLRAGLDVRVPFDAFALLAGASYLQILSAEPMNDRFAHETIAGIGGELGGALRVAPWLEARLTAHYDRIFSSLHPEPGETYVAGGSLDQYLSLDAGASAVF